MSVKTNPILEMLMNDENDDDKVKELPLGKETEANLFKSRSIFIYGPITQELAQKVNTQLVALAAASDEDIRIYVNSPGGHVESGDSIHDMIKFIKPKVWMIGTGWVASAGALIYVAAPKERRIALPNTRFLLHQPSGGTRGMASDIEIQAREIIKMNERLIKIFAKATGQSEEKIAKDIDRDYWLSAEEGVPASSHAARSLAAVSPARAMSVCLACLESATASTATSTA